MTGAAEKDPGIVGLVVAVIFIALLVCAGVAFLAGYVWGRSVSSPGRLDLLIASLLIGVIAGALVGYLRLPGIVRRLRSRNSSVRSNDTRAGNTWAVAVTIGWAAALAVLWSGSTNVWLNAFVVVWVSSTLGLTGTYAVAILVRAHSKSGTQR